MNRPQGRYHTLSPWIRTPADLRPPLRGEARADVAVVGGGYMGLSAALRLRAAGCDVAILERAFCGAGASGRNAGHLTPTIGKDIYTCLRRWGARGVALAALAQEAVAMTERMIQDLEIACDYRPSGNIVVGLHPDHSRLLQRAARVAAAAGLRPTFLDGADLRARGIPEAFDCGVLEPDGGHLHPGEYATGLRRAALAAGVRIYESTAVTHLAPQGPPRLVTPSGVLSAERVLLATNAFVEPDLACARRRILPLRVSLFRTRRLTARELTALGWTGREGLYTAHGIMESYRLTGDDRLVGGSKWVTLGDGGPEPPAASAAECARYDALLARRFPEAPRLEIEDYWSGWIAGTVDHLPLVGRLKRRPDVAYALGCNGHGIALATHLGAAMADRLLGLERADLDVLGSGAWPVPTGALRRLAFHAVARPLERQDAKVDREVEERRASVRPGLET